WPRAGARAARARPRRAWQQRPVLRMGRSDRGGGRAPGRPWRRRRAWADRACRRAWRGHERVLPRPGRFAARVPPLLGLKRRPPLPPGPFLVVGLARSAVAAALPLRARR